MWHGVYICRGYGTVFICEEAMVRCLYHVEDRYGVDIWRGYGTVFICVEDVARCSICVEGMVQCLYV